MSKEIKQKADKLVELFWNNSFTTKYEATEIAILHQKRLIDELEGLFIDNNIDVMNEAEIRIYKKREEQKAILAELESRL